MRTMTNDPKRFTGMHGWALRTAVACGWDYAAIARLIIGTESEARRMVVEAMDRAGLPTRADVARWVATDDRRIAALPAKPVQLPSRRPVLPRYTGATLYRYFDADGTLLYIGITSVMVQRSNQHVRASMWWPLARTCTLEHFDTTEEVLEAERRAIIAERPPYNRQHHPVWDTPEARRERRAALFEEDGA